MTVRELCLRGREAIPALQSASGKQRNDALLAMAKLLMRDAELILEANKKDLSGAAENGVPAQIAAEIYDEILDFANYAFNKAHAVSYAIVAYQTAYLKYYYPCQYMAALITSVLDNTAKISEYIADCRENGNRAGYLHRPGKQRMVYLLRAL